MIKIKQIILLLSISLAVISCSKKLTVENINKPFYKDIKKNIRKWYRIEKEFSSNVKPFKYHYESVKFETDLVTNFRTKIIDSLDLLNKDNWLLITEYSQSSSVAYYKTYIFDGKKYYKYEYSEWKITKDGVQSYVYEYDIDKIRKDDEDIADIYNAFQDSKVPSKLNIEPYALKTYKIIFVKDKKIKSYKMTSQNYILEKW